MVFSQSLVLEIRNYRVKIFLCELNCKINDNGPEDIYAYNKYLKEPNTLPDM